MNNYDFIVVGGGAAGMTSAFQLWQHMPDANILLIDRKEQLGGVLLQCTHRGFGSSCHNADYTGYEYAKKLEQQLKKTSVQILLCTEVLEISQDKTLLCSNTQGIHAFSFEHLILASGCTERALGALNVSGTRPSGIYTAGEIQRRMNLLHQNITGDAVIIGSGDIAMIIARQLSLCDQKILCMTEIQDKSPALLRNRANCQEAFGIPLLLRTKLVRIHGYPHIKSVTLQDIPTGSFLHVDCSLLIIAAGLLPDRSLIQNFFPPLWEAPQDLQLLPDWLHLCGNCHHIHPVVDSISLQSEKLAQQLLQSFWKNKRSVAP